MLENLRLYFDGPSVAQGAAGKWFVSGGITLSDGVNSNQFYVELWDGTTVIDSSRVDTSTAAPVIKVSLSGVITSPAGNLNISEKPNAATTSFIRANISGLAKDSTITAVRIA